MVLIPKYGGLLEYSISWNHEIGHLGIFKSFSDICKVFNWPKLYEDVLTYDVIRRLCPNNKKTKDIPSG